MSNAGDVEGLESEIERLTAERDRLALEAAQLDERVHGGLLRRVSVAILVVVTCVSFFTAATGFWVNRNLLETDVWVERVGPLASDPAVQQALGTELTDQVMEAVDPKTLFEEALPEKGQILAGPLSGAVRTFVDNAVTRFVASDAFAEVWVTLNRNGHDDAVAVLRGQDPSPLVSVGDGTVQVSLVPAIDAVLTRISEVSPEVLGTTVSLPKLSADDLPDDAREKIGDALGVNLDDDFAVITVYDGDALSTSQTALKVFDRLLVPAILLTLLLVPVTLVLSRRRRRTALQLLVGGALAMVLLRRISLRLVDEVVNLAQIPGNKAALESILGAFLDPLISATRWILLGFALAVVILLITGPYRWAKTLRDGATSLARATVAETGPAQRDTAVQWVRDHAVVAQWAGALAFLAGLWWLDLSWMGLLLLAAVVGAFELWVNRVASGAVSSVVEGDVGDGRQGDVVGVTASTGGGEDN